MIKIADFNSLWEISFGVNAIFVYFELAPRLEQKFKGINAIGKNIVEEINQEEDQSFVITYGWRSLFLGYFIWILQLKKLSIINSFISLLLIAVAGFNPESGLSVLTVCITILTLFTPVVCIPIIILYFFPKYKSACLKEAIEKLALRLDDSSEGQEQKQKYKDAIDRINNDLPKEIC
jgi:hypothetical protein